MAKTDRKDSRILVVDDEKSNVLLLERLLHGAGYWNVTGLTDSREVAAMAASEPLDLIVLDLQMPHLNGHAVLEQLRDQTFLPVLVLTGDLTREAREKALSGGAKDFLTKPLDPAETLLRIRNLLETRHLHLELQAQRSELEEQLRHFQKLEEVGRLSGGIAHDFNNMLAGIRAYVDLALMDVPEGSTRDDLKAIRKITTRAAAVTRRLLLFSRSDTPSDQSVDLGQLVHDTVSWLGHLIGEEIELGYDFPAHLDAVTADPGHLEQVLMNLVLNARDAIQGRGTIRISARNVAFAEDDPERPPFVVPGDYVQLVVSDTGKGMSAEVREKLFKPFFTTKERGKGTGLGLAIVYGIVKQCRGYIWVQSTEGAGSSFILAFPAAHSAAALPQPIPSLQMGAETKTVLLVEDEEMVRIPLRRILIKGGYRVFEARTGREALQFCEQYQGPVHLVLSDLVLPEIGGTDLASRLREIRPEVRTLFMSGYPDQELQAGGDQPPGASLIRKPFEAWDLVARVRQLLDG